jgi:hypothetical protein
MIMTYPLAKPGVNVKNFSKNINYQMWGGHVGGFIYICKVLEREIIHG